MTKYVSVYRCRLCGVQYIEEAPISQYLPCAARASNAKRKRS